MKIALQAFTTFATASPVKGKILSTGESESCSLAMRSGTHAFAGANSSSRKAQITFTFITDSFLKKKTSILLVTTMWWLKVQLFNVGNGRLEHF